MHIGRGGLGRLRQRNRRQCAIKTKRWQSPEKVPDFPAGSNPEVPFGIYIDFYKVFPGKEIEGSGKLFKMRPVTLLSQAWLWSPQVFPGGLQHRLPGSFGCLS